MSSYTKIWVGSAATNTLILLAGVLSGIILARVLEPEGRGILAAILFWPHFIAGVGALGINESITIERAKSRVAAEVMQSTAIWLSLAVAGVLTIIFSYGIPYLLTEEITAYEELIQQYFVIFVFSTMLYMNLTAIDLGGSDYRRYNFLRLVQAACYPLLLVGFWTFNGLTVITAAYSAIAGAAVVSIIRVIIDRKSIPVRPNAALLKTLLSSGMRLHGANLAFFLVAEIDKMFLVRFSEPKELGFYVVALTIAATGQGVIAKTFADIILPRVSTNEPVDTLGAENVRIVQRAFLLILLCNAILLAIVPWLIPFVFGNVFTESVAIAQILLVAFLFQGVRKTMIYILRAKYKNVSAARSELLVALIFIATIIPLYSRAGIIGVAIALLIGHLIGTIYLAGQYKRMFGISWADWRRLDLKSELGYLLSIAKAGLATRLKSL